MARLSPFVLATMLLLLAGCVKDAPEPHEPPMGDAPPTQHPHAETLGGIWAGDERAIGVRPIETVIDGSLRHPLTRVLLVPPTHGDLGSGPAGAGFQPYLDATMRGIKMWEPIIDRFIAQYPAYAYLDDVTVEVEVFDGGTPSAAGYDVIIGYLETTGPTFRGMVTYVPSPLQPQDALDAAGLGDVVHYGNRYMILSLMASAPRGGQLVPDWPELNDLQSVTMHEFAHAWGLGHTTTWTERYGPDLMNSPYPLVYGDGDPIGDGEERTHLLCHSTLDLEGLAYLYRWLPNGTWEGSTGEKDLTLPYEWLCPEGHAPPSPEAGQIEVWFGARDHPTQRLH